MPQISPISWTLIVLSIILFMSVINSNMTNPINTENYNNSINMNNNTINW